MNPIEKAKKIKLLILDVDGVLSDASLYYSEEGEALKPFSVRDGLGIKVMQKHGLQVAVISGRQSKALNKRMADLGIDHFYSGQLNKKLSYEDLMSKVQLQAEEVAYLGDDVIDLPVMRKIGLPMAVADAHALVLAEAAWVSRHIGGHGAVREACDFILGSRMSPEEIYGYILNSERDR